MDLVIIICASGYARSQACVVYVGLCKYVTILWFMAATLCRWHWSVVQVFRRYQLFHFIVLECRLYQNLVNRFAFIPFSEGNLALPV